MSGIASCDEAVASIERMHGPLLGRIWREELHRRRERLARADGPTLDMRAVARGIRAFREKHSLAATELAERMGLGRTSVWKTEMGRTILTPERAQQYAEALGVTVRELEFWGKLTTREGGEE